MSSVVPVSRSDDSLFIGIDVGTSSVRVLAVDALGMVAAEAVVPHATLIPRPGWTEQRPEDWWAGAARGLRQVTCALGARAARIRAVGVTGQMHGSVFLDGRGEVIRPAILWNDQRTAEQCASIEAVIGRAGLLAKTGNVALTGFTSPKILWLREHEPQAYRRLAKVLLPKDYVRFRLTGEQATDMSDASGTLLFDVRRRRWAVDVVEALGLKPGILPDLFEGTDVTGAVTGEAARATGLPAGIPVVGGGGDQAAGAVGAGVVDPGAMCCSLGTSGVLFAPCAAFPGALPPGVQFFCHAVPGRWHAMGVMLSAGGALAWFRTVLVGGSAGNTEASGSAGEAEAKDSPGETSAGAGPGRAEYAALMQEAARIGPGAGGLIFLPYLSGERTPHMDPHARAAFLGLGLHHGRAHMVRAVMEGVAFGLRDAFSLLESMGLASGEIFLTGGGARSDLWCSILASVLGTCVTRMRVDQGPAMGAAILAMVGAGHFPDAGAACRRIVEPADSFEPDPAARRIYDDLYAIYAEAYPGLRGCTARLAALQSLFDAAG